MLTKIDAKNARNSHLELPLSNELIGSDPLQIRNITGLGPVRANINTTPFGSINGESYFGSSVGKRNIVLTIGLNPDWDDQSMESLRALLYDYFMTQYIVVLQFLSTHLPTVEITGYVESVEPNIFSKDPEVQVSIICPTPDFVAIDDTVLTGVVDDNILGGTVIPPTDIDYIGTVPTGFVLKIESSLARPSYTGIIYATVVDLNNTDESSLLTITGTVDATAYAKISTEKGNKYAKQFGVVSGLVTADYLSTVVISGSLAQWPQLQPGENRFFVNAANAGQAWTLTYFARFGGL